MPIFKTSKKYAKTMTALTGVFSMIAMPYVAHQAIDEGIYGADQTELSETDANRDHEYLQNRMDELSSATTELNTLKAAQGDLYREGRDNAAPLSEDQYRENALDIEKAEDDIRELKQDIFNNLYTNRTMSEESLEGLMEAYRVLYGAAVEYSGEIHEDNARNIRECQVRNDLTGTFASPDRRMAERIESCADWNASSRMFSIMAALVTFFAGMGLFLIKADNLHNRFENQHLRAVERKERSRPPKPN